MKVLLLNGSRREKGCTFTALSEVADTLNSFEIDTEIIHIGKGDPDKLVEEVHAKLKTADAIVVGSPVYFAGASGEGYSFLDRLFICAEKDLRLKPAAAVVSARRAGTTAALDDLNKYFAYAEMPIVSSRYWNMVHGSKPEDVQKDEEGLQIMRILGRNMAWLLKCIECGKAGNINPPEFESKIFTNFVR